MRRKSPLVRQSSETDINNAMTPMIDVVFLLLVFFVWTASFQVIEFVMPPSEMSSQMGSAPSKEDQPPPKDIEDIVIRIRWSPQSQTPQWTLGETQVASIQEVGNQLKRLASVLVDSQAEDETLVILHPDPEVPLGYVIETYDTALVSGFSKLSFAVNR